jgi:hypothetical protein
MARSNPRKNIKSSDQEQLCDVTREMRGWRFGDSGPFWRGGFLLLGGGGL